VLPIVGTIALTLFGVLFSSKKVVAICLFFFACVSYIGAICVYWIISLPQSNVQFEIPSAEQKSNDKDEPLLVRTFWLNKEQGSSITLGPCPGKRCIKFILGEIEQKDNVLVQKIYVEASFLEFKRHPKYPDIKYMDSGFHSKGCALAYSIDGSKIWFELALLKGKMCEVFSKDANITIAVVDTRTDSLRIKLEVRSGNKSLLPSKLTNRNSSQNAPQIIPQQMKNKNMEEISYRPYISIKPGSIVYGSWTKKEKKDDPIVTQRCDKIMLYFAVNNTGDVPAANVSINAISEIIDEKGVGKFSPAEFKTSYTHNLHLIAKDHPGRQPFILAIDKKAIDYFKSGIIKVKLSIKIEYSDLKNRNVYWFEGSYIYSPAFNNSAKEISTKGT
jgi:hypothetical protein